MKKIVYTLSLVFVLFSCSDTGEGPQTPDDNGDTYDRGAMLVTYADQFIIPGYSLLDEELTQLKNTTELFLDGSASLDALKADWLQAYKAWQKVEVYNIGPGEEFLLIYRMNVYPTNVEDIQANIASGSYDLTHPNNTDAIGFPAVEYLLYQSDLSDASTKAYLSDLVDYMYELNQAVLTQWNGSYRETFVNSTGNTASSAVNQLVNDYIYYVEKGFRANKIGIPAGIFSSTPLPDRAESLYAETYSKELCLEALDAIEAFFTGENEGLEAYLTHLGNTGLVSDIKNQLATARSKVEGLEDNFSNQVETDNIKMLQAYDEIQKIVVLLKVDVLQELNIAVDYVDADGD